MASGPSAWPRRADMAGGKVCMPCKTCAIAAGADMLQRGGGGAQRGARSGGEQGVPALP